MEASSNEESDMSSDSSTNGRSAMPAWRLHMCTMCYAGIMIGYAGQANLGTSELLRLGVEPSNLSFAWLAGPLSGLFMQPIVGYLSDLLRMRRPFIALGSLSTSFSLLYLAMASNRYAGIVAFYALDLSLQVIQAPVRAIVTDAVPPKQRTAAAAGLAAAAAAGALIAGALAATDWIYVFKVFRPSYATLFTHAQIVLMISAALVMLFVTPCVMLAPRVPPSDFHNNPESSISTTLDTESGRNEQYPQSPNSSPFSPQPQANTLFNSFIQIFSIGRAQGTRTGHRLHRPFFCARLLRSVRAPRPFWQSFVVQLCTWSGFFANAVYANAWVGMYIFDGDGSAAVGSEERESFETGIRLGSFAAAIGAVITLLISITLSRCSLPLRRVYIISQLMETFSLCAPFLLQHLCRSRSRILAVLIISSFGVVPAITNVAPWLIVAQALQLSERTRSRVGFFTTLFNVSQSLPQLIIGLVAPLILLVAQNDPAAVMFCTGVLALLGAVLIVTLDVDRLDSGERISMNRNDEHYRP